MGPLADSARRGALLQDHRGRRGGRPTPRRDDRAPACNGADVLAAVIHLVHQADLPLLMMTAMDAENEIPVGAPGMGRQVLLPGGKCLPVGGAGTLAAGGVVDPVEERRPRQSRTASDDPSWRFPCVPDGRERHPLVQMSHGLKMLSVVNAISMIWLWFHRLAREAGTMAGAGLQGGRPGMSEARGGIRNLRRILHFINNFWVVGLSL